MRHTMVFVGGLHRSGTTLLASLLGEHPDISGFEQTGAPEGEGQYLQTVLPVDEHHGGPGRFAFFPDAHLTEESPLATPENARLLRRQWDRYWDLSRPVLLEKSPPNLLRFRLLQRMFPDARFVLMMRHPVPVSLSTRSWAPALTPRELVWHWVHAHDLAFQDIALLRNALVVRYERLLADPAETLAEVSAFAGLRSGPPAERLALRRLDQSVNRRYFDRWRTLVGDDPPKRWPGGLEAAVNAHGYSLRPDATDGPMLSASARSR
ncbi:sulfotransferase family protein [Actinomadura sp. 1N219]|uniref:sulfotransferase family protein n=1 Tax=Actinomadura sp. 1N219 TaxID=3375152 RepID=UPI0037A9BB12